MRVAVCISGQPRNIVNCVESLSQNFLSGVESDFFIHFWASSSNEELLSFKEFARAKKPWNRHLKKKKYLLKYERYVENRRKINDSFPRDPDEIRRVSSEAYRPKKLLVENQKEFDTSDFNRHEQNMTIRTGETRPRDVLSMFYGIGEANKLMNDHRRECGIAYDCVIRCRSDLFFHRPFDIRLFSEVMEKYVIVPDVQNWGGGKNDQLAISSPANMNVYCRAYDSIRSYYESGGMFHPEIFLSWYLEQNALPCCHVPIDYEILRGGPAKERPVVVPKLDGATA